MPVRALPSTEKIVRRVKAPSELGKVPVSALSSSTRTFKSGITLVDTPGLIDVAAQEQAAKQIQAAVMQEGLFKVIFVIEMKNGRTDPVDLLLMEWVLKQAQQVYEKKEYRQKHLLPTALYGNEQLKLIKDVKL